MSIIYCDDLWKEYHSSAKNTSWNHREIKRKEEIMNKRNKQREEEYERQEKKLMEKEKINLQDNNIWNKKMSKAEKEDMLKKDELMM